MNKCEGCGALLQISNKDAEGYTLSLNHKLCERCFRIKNYNDYKIIVKDNNDFINILKGVNETHDLVVLVVDLFNINKELINLKKYITNRVLLVLTKRDLFPQSLYEEKLKNYFERYELDVVDTLIISSTKNYHFDMLLDKINQYKTSNKVYVVGYTNAGKSSMINKLLHHYSSNKQEVTTSMLQSTTIDSIEIKLNDSLTLVDTPGLLDKNNIINYIDIDTLKLITPQKEIRPITYQVHAAQSLFAGDLLRVDCVSDNSLTFYITNEIPITRSFKDTDKLIDLEKHELDVDNNSDIVITGFCFIKVMKKSHIVIYTVKGVDVYTRDALI